LVELLSMLQNVKIIRVKLDLSLLQALDEAARHSRVNRSFLISAAVREHLRRLETQKLEALDLRGYFEVPDDCAEIADWERVAEPWELV